MARQARLDTAGQIYHVINRSNARLSLFKTKKDFTAILESLNETILKIPIEIFSYALMSNHWHFAVRTKQDGDLGQFFGKFTQKVTQRWHAQRRSAGSGHLFQGRFKSFLVETDEYFIQLMRYIEANPLRARMVKQAEDYQWTSLFARQNPSKLTENLLHEWVVPEPKDYLEIINKPMPQKTLQRIRSSVVKGMPYGGDVWVRKMVSRYDLGYTLQKVGRPKKNE